MAMLLDDRILDPSTNHAAPNVHRLSAGVVLEVHREVSNHQALTTVTTHVESTGKPSSGLASRQYGAVSLNIDSILSHRA